MKMCIMLPNGKLIQKKPNATEIQEQGIKYAKSVRCKLCQQCSFHEQYLNITRLRMRR